MTISARGGSGIKIIFLSVVYCLALLRGVHAEPLVVGYSAVSSVFLPFWIGKEVGYYKKEGLNLFFMRTG